MDKKELYVMFVSCKQEQLLFLYVWQEFVF